LIGDFEQYAHYLELSAKHTDSENFWLISSKAFLRLINNDISTSKILLDKASKQKPTDYNLLKSYFLYYLKTVSLDVFAEMIKPFILANHNDFDLNLLLGQTSYFQNNCSLAISQYNQGMKENRKAMFELWDFVQGGNHLLNLAHCYQMMGQLSEADDLLKEFQQSVQSLPIISYEIPGKIYNQARYLKLTGKQEEANILLDKIQDWPLIWIVNLDPTWQ